MIVGATGVRRFAGAILLLSMLLAGGCSWWSAPVACEYDSTQMFHVTPTNGVWDVEYGRTDNPTNCSFSFCVARRADGIVVRARVLDDLVVTDNGRPGDVSCPTWNDDALQCYFDGDNDRSPDSRADEEQVRWGGEYALAANGAAQSDYSCCPKSFGRDWKGTVSVTQRSPRYVTLDYELWFSWACLGRVTAPAADEDVTFGFNICYHDDDTGGRADRALYWVGNPSRPYRDESRFQTLTLRGRGRVE